MFFVLLDHFGQTFFTEGDSPLARWMAEVGMVATPTFVAISGMLIGFLHRSRGADFQRMRVKLVDRGLFLLLVGHLLILGAHLTRTFTLRYIFITDIVGVSMIVQPWIVTTLRPRARVWIGLVAYVVSWVVIESWHPHASLLMAVKEATVGSRDQAFMVYVFPLVPWFGFDMACTALGDRLGVHFVKGHPKAMARLMARVSLCGVLASVGLLAAHLVVKALAHGGRLAGAALQLAYALTSVSQKLPPAPAYLAFFGTAGSCLITFWLIAVVRGWIPRATRVAAEIGQGSFVMFTLQYYLFYTLLFLVRPRLPAAGLWPIYLFACVFAVAAAAYVWQRRGGSRFLTVGYASLVEWRRTAASGGRRSDTLVPGVTG